MANKRSGGPTVQELNRGLLEEFRDLYNNYLKANPTKGQKGFRAYCSSIGLSMHQDTINYLISGRVNAKKLVSPGTIYKLEKIIASSNKQVA